MAQDFSSDGLLSYLREETVAGRMHPATARSQRKAAEALFAFLNEDERSDLRSLDLRVLTSRIDEAPQGELRGELVGLYSQRLAGALEEYLGASSTTSGSKPGSYGASSPVSGSELEPGEQRALESVRLSFDRYKADVVPIPLGTGRVVYLHGLPADLSADEAERISRVIKAFAVDDGS